MSMAAARDVAAALAARLGQITKANGYHTDIGLRVYRGRRKLDMAKIPCVVLGEGDDEVQANSLRNANIKQTYVFEALHACDPDNPNDTAHDLIEDLKRAIFSGDTTFGRTVRSLEYRGRLISPREDGAALVAASIEITAGFVEDLTAP